MTNSLMQTVDFNNVEQASSFLETNLDVLTSSPIESFNFLREVIQKNNYTLFNSALAGGISIECRGYKQISPLLFACRFADLEMVQFIVSKGVNIYSLCVEGNNVLQHALKNRNTQEAAKIAKYFIELGINPYNRNFAGRNVYHEFADKFPTVLRFMTDNTTFNKEDVSIKEALKNRDFELAYQIANLNLSKIGTILPSQLTPDYKNVFLDLMLTSLYSDRIEEFKQFTQLTLQITPDSHYFYGQISFYSGLIDMSEQNLETAVDKIDVYLKKSKHNKFDEGFALMILFYLHSKLENKKELNKVKAKLKNRLEYFVLRDGFLKYLYPLFIHHFGDIGHENTLFTVIQDLDLKVRSSSLENPAASTDRIQLCTLGALYFDLKGDVENRDLLLNFGDLESKKNFNNLVSITNYILKRVCF